MEVNVDIHQKLYLVTGTVRRDVMLLKIALLALPASTIVGVNPSLAFYLPFASRGLFRSRNAGESSVFHGDKAWCRVRVREADEQMRDTIARIIRHAKCTMVEARRAGWLLLSVPWLLSAAPLSVGA